MRFLGRLGLCQCIWKDFGRSKPQELAVQFESQGFVGIFYSLLVWIPSGNSMKNILGLYSFFASVNWKLSGLSVAEPRGTCDESVAKGKAENKPKEEILEQVNKVLTTLTKSGVLSHCDISKVSTPTIAFNTMSCCCSSTGHSNRNITTQWRHTWMMYLFTRGMRLCATLNSMNYLRFLRHWPTQTPYRSLGCNEYQVRRINWLSAVGLLILAKIWINKNTSSDWNMKGQPCHHLLQLLPCFEASGAPGKPKIGQNMNRKCIYTNVAKHAVCFWFG